MHKYFKMCYKSPYSSPLFYLHTIFAAMDKIHNFLLTTTVKKLKYMNINNIIICNIYVDLIVQSAISFMPYINKFVKVISMKKKPCLNYII